MKQEEAGELCIKLTDAARRCKTLKEKEEESSDLSSAQKDLMAVKQEMRLAIMKSGAEKIKNIYKTTGSLLWFDTRSKSPPMLAEEILKNIEKHNDSEKDFLQFVSDSLRNVRVTRTDKPNEAVGIYEKNGSLSNGGRLIQLAFESYVLSKLTPEQLDGISVLGLDFGTANVRDGTDTTSILFREFLTVVQNPKLLTEEDQRKLDEKIFTYIEQREKKSESVVGQYHTYSTTGKQDFINRGDRYDSVYSFLSKTQDIVSEKIIKHLPEKETVVKGILQICVNVAFSGIPGLKEEAKKLVSVTTEVIHESLKDEGIKIPLKQQLEDMKKSDPEEDKGLGLENK
ncbi:TPA: hypothetical protein ACJ6XF_000115 [Legionella pneumophila]|nr:hypothetical protein [Legionella pneumophila]